MTHPANLADETRSMAFLKSVRDYIKHPDDGPYWRGRAEQRITALERDEPRYGLLPHEERELTQLKRLIERAK